MKIPLIRKATASKGKFIWPDDLEREYIRVRTTIPEQISLTQYDENKTVRLILDGASTEGVGFVLFQWIDEMDPSKLI